MRVITRRRLGVIAAATALLASAACGGDGGAEVEGIQIVEADKLTVCTHLPYAPFQDRDPKDPNKIVGFDVDLLDLLAKDLGLQQKVVNLGEWTQVTSGAAFKANRCDVGMGAMTITPERAKALTISDPYFDATQVLVVKKGAPYKSLEDLAGKRVGVQADTTGQAYVQEQAKKIEGLQPIKFDDLALQLNAVKAGSVDAAVSDNGPVLNFVKNNPDTQVVATFQTDEKYGFPAAKDENGQRLIDRLNAVLAEAKKDGTYDKIYEKWFGVKPGEELSS
ncbi:MAG TPA: ABC transporter substrate-binding protein [Actinopolymorphaceae bacterium]